MKEKDVTEQFPKEIEGKLNIYFHVSENSGVGYYRLYLPAAKLREHKLAQTMISDFKWGEGDHKEPDMKLLFDICNWADLIVAGRKDLPDFYAKWGGIREFFNIPIIMDTDDNIRHVRPDNPGYQGYHPGSPAIDLNKYAISKVFDAITVSTEHLKEFHKKENPRIYVMPNNLDLVEWNKHESKVHNDGLIRLAFLGSSAHQSGMQIIKKPLFEILKKYPNTRFLVTHVYRDLFKEFSQDQIEYIPWIKLEEWQKGVKSLGIDIGLAPLADNMFNRSKSNLRWIEYAAAGIPAIVSNVLPYRCVTNKKNAIIVKEQDEWFAAMEKMITDEKFRKKIKKNAYEEVKKSYDIDKNIPLWAKTYEEVHRKYHEFYGEKKNYYKLASGKYKLIES